jgi:glycosyltransferase involved in cell wall biosynthesis
MKNKKLCYFISEDWYFCSHRLDLARQAMFNSFDVSVIVRVSKHGNEITEAGIELLPLSLARRGINPLKEIKTIWCVYQYYKKKQPDVVHNVALKPVLYGTLAAKFAGVPVIINAFAGMGLLFSTQSIKASVLRFVFKVLFQLLLRNTHIIVQNPDDYEIINNIGLKYVSLIKGAGVDINSFKPVPEKQEEPLVILPARMLWKKGVGKFVQAAKQIKKEGIKARFALVGMPDNMNPTSVSQEQLKKWQDEGAVEVWGKKDNMPNIFAQSHIVCLPSTYGEGIPKVLIEAAACARPIVTNNIPGCREIVINNENGFLVKPDNLDDLIEKLKLLLADPALRKKMGHKGREMVEEKFSANKIHSQTIELYNNLLTST